MSNIKKILQELTQMSKEDRQELIEALSDNTLSSAKKRKQNRQKKNIDTQDDFKQDNKNRVKKVENKNQTKSIKGRNNKGIQAAGEKIDTSGKRPTLFLEQGFDDFAKSDVKIDKLLNEDKNPTERRNEITYWSVDCSQCGKTFECHPSMVYRDDDGYVAICNKCGGRR